MFVAAALSAVMAKFVFYYGWSWMESFLFGSIMSATDPVAVVAILSGLGKLGVTIKNCPSNCLLVKLWSSITLIETDFTEIELLSKCKYFINIYFVKFHNAEFFSESNCNQEKILDYWSEKLQSIYQFFCVCKNDNQNLISKVNTGLSNLTQMI